MARTDSDSDVGRRLERRARTELIAELVTLRGLQQVRVESLSSCGAGLKVDHLPEIGSTIVLAWPVHALCGTVAWAKGRRCGISFSPAVPEATIAEIVRTNGGAHIDSLARLAKSGSFSDLGKI
ncbi:PilZ domain-containing protein [Novosphingobium sp. G106]|uniref:PilZ domain-containing protein n=1 Tax=Novosphingobium sp. G106 TaxID=2849500 RepID=UPI0035C8590C